MNFIEVTKAEMTSGKNVNDDVFQQVVNDWHTLADSEKAAFLAAWATRPSSNGNGSAGATGTPAKYSTWGDIDAMLGPITWVWPGWLPAGMLTIIAAEPGVGKSALCLRIAQTLIGNRIDWPDGKLFDGGDGRVVWAESESGQAINLERAKAWKIDTSRIIQPGLPLEDFRLDDDAKMAALIDLAHLSDVRAVIIDSLRGANSRNENDSDVIGLVMQLSQLARDTNKPIILTHHLRKRGLLDGPDGPNLDRLRGSSAIVQPARVVWTLDTPDPQDKETRRLAQAKNNLARTPQPLGLTISEHGVLFVDAPEPPRTVSRQEQAINFLLATLADGALPADEVYEQAQLAGHSKSTLDRAKTKIGVVSFKNGMGSGGWQWGLPAKN